MEHRHVLIAMEDGTRLAARLFLPDELPLNALWAAHEVVGREGRVRPALPHDDVLELLAAHGRLDA